MSLPALVAGRAHSPPPQGSARRHKYLQCVGVTIGDHHDGGRPLLALSAPKRHPKFSSKQANRKQKVPVVANWGPGGQHAPAIDSNGRPMTHGSSIEQGPGIGKSPDPGLHTEIG
jgi:hypothetical protein